MRQTCGIKAEAGCQLGSHTVHTLKNGLRVGLVGLVTNWIKRVGEAGEPDAGLTIEQIPTMQLCDAVQALQGRVDVLVGIYHGGLRKAILETGETA